MRARRRGDIPGVEDEVVSHGSDPGADETVTRRTQEAAHETAGPSDDPRGTIERRPGPAPVREAPVLREADEVCEIAFWRGYVKAMFYAQIFTQDGEPRAVAESRSFRSPGDGEPDKTQEAVDAQAALHEHLLATGWEHVGQGPAWYADVFRRTR